MSVFGGEQFRPLLQKDVARAIEIAIKSKKRGIYNLSYKNMKIIDIIVREIQKYFKNTKIIKTKIKFQDARNYKVK